MDPDHQVAAEFCALVEVSDLFEYLGVPKTATPDEAREALAKKRRYMQGMQNNPKFQASARFLIKNMRALEKAVDERDTHLATMQRIREDAQLPALVLAIDSALADGHLDAREEAFLRSRALEMGIREARYEEVLEQRADALDASIHLAAPSTGPQVQGEALGVSPEAATTARLRGAEGHGWWDAPFTLLLLEMIPGGPGEMVDLYCRTGLSATTVLPERPQLAWLGVDPSGERLSVARGIVGQAALPHPDRISFATGQPQALPLEADSVDYVLSIRALANVPDTRPVLEEAERVLRDGGRLIVAEPDGLSEAFYFDGHLTDYNAAFQRLCAEVDGARGGSVHPLGRPGLAIGPTLPARLEAAGFEVSHVRVHASNNLAPRPFRSLARRLRKYPQALARSAGLERSELLAQVLAAVDALELRIPGDHVGLSGHVLPLFLACGIREG